MSVYNTDKWLEEAVESVISQDIGFKDNVQIIFVNDGSPDNSEKLCKHYAKIYPSNIVYVKKENGGLASARNVGIEYVEGEFVSFFDPDDILTADTLTTVYNFFKNNYEEIDLVAIKMEFFEARTGPHMLNYKFSEDMVIDLEKHFDHPQLSAASAFFKASAIGNLRFDNDLKFSEDARFVPVFISQKMKYGVVAKPTYYYRRRHEANSIINSRDKSNYWFLTVTDKVYSYLIDYSLKEHHKVLKFIQYTILYDLHGAIMDKNNTGVLTESEFSEYKNRVNSLMDHIDDDVILAAKNIFKEYKLFLLSRKRKESGEKHLKVTDGVVTYRGNAVHKLKSTKVSVELMSAEANSLTLEGRYSGLKVDGAQLVFKAGKKIYKARDVFRGANPSTYMRETIHTANGFSVDIPLIHGDDIRAYIVTSDKTYRVKLVFKKTARLSSEVPSSYTRINNWLLIYGTNSLTISRASTVRHIKKEYKFLMDCKKNKQIEVIRVRLLAYIFRIFHYKEIWIISDRLVAARDNGEALFRYLSSQKFSQNVYFAVNKNSQDFERMKKYGKIVDRQSLKYKLLFLSAKKIISSHFDDFVINAFGNDEASYRDLYRFDFVFLQHGITHNDMSNSLNRFKKNIKLFITATPSEYKSVLDGNYGYTGSKIKQTGFPRFDMLESNPRKKLVIMPTWRRVNILKPSAGTDRRQYDKNFKNSEYFVFYNTLINDRRVIDSLRKHNMKCEFYVHPNFSVQAKDFVKNSNLIIKKMPYDYATAFSEGNLLVTDYSSVAFDFAYLKKPIIYSQYDKYHFRSGHYNEGYFSYELDGFGPVVTSYEATVKKILRYIEADCVMPLKYQKRVDKFYSFRDKNNSKRVYEAIKHME